MDMASEPSMSAIGRTASLDRSNSIDDTDTHKIRTLGSKEFSFDDALDDVKLPTNPLASLSVDSQRPPASARSRTDSAGGNDSELRSLMENVVSKHIKTAKAMHTHAATTTNANTQVLDGARGGAGNVSKSRAAAMGTQKRLQEYLHAPNPMLAAVLTHDREAGKKNILGSGKKTISMKDRQHGQAYGYLHTHDIHGSKHDDDDDKRSDTHSDTHSDTRSNTRSNSFADTTDTDANTPPKPSQASANEPSSEVLAALLASMSTDDTSPAKASSLSIDTDNVRDALEVSSGVEDAPKSPTSQAVAGVGAGASATGDSATAGSPVRSSPSSPKVPPLQLSALLGTPANSRSSPFKEGPNSSNGNSNGKPSLLSGTSGSRNNSFREQPASASSNMVLSSPSIPAGLLMPMPPAGGMLPRTASFRDNSGRLTASSIGSPISKQTQPGSAGGIAEREKRSDGETDAGKNKDDDIPSEKDAHTPLLEDTLIIENPRVAALLKGDDVVPSEIDAHSPLLEDAIIIENPRVAAHLKGDDDIPSETSGHTPALDDNLLIAPTSIHPTAHMNTQSQGRTDSRNTGDDIPSETSGHTPTLEDNVLNTSTLSHMNPRTDSRNTADDIPSVTDGGYTPAPEDMFRADANPDTASAALDVDAAADDVIGDSIDDIPPQTHVLLQLHAPSSLEKICAQMDGHVALALRLRFPVFKILEILMAIKTVCFL
jgi:hypothetical protein